VEGVGFNLVGKYLWSRVSEFGLAQKEWNALVPVWWAKRCGVGFPEFRLSVWNCTFGPALLVRTT
jgi:hypothetical protein